MSDDREQTATGADPAGSADRAGGDVERRELARRAIGMIDLTDLADDRAVDGIDRLCEKAAEHSTAAVCVWPDHVERCRSNLEGTSIPVATVVNFPSGDEAPSRVYDQTLDALSDGAAEIDLVMPYRAFVAGDERRVRDLIVGVGDLVAPPHHLKVILEVSDLPDSESVRRAAALAIDCGADFVKTSTGKSSSGATPDSVSAMLEAIRDADRPVGIKPSGGIRTFTDAATYLSLADGAMGAGWATPATFRFGASSLLDELLAFDE